MGEENVYSFGSKNSGPAGIKLSVNKKLKTGFIHQQSTDSLGSTYQKSFIFPTKKNS